MQGTITTDEQDWTIEELMVRHIECSVDRTRDRDDVQMTADGGEAVYLIAGDGSWGVIDRDCESCGGTGYRPEFVKVGEVAIWCACVRPDKDSGEWA